MYKTTMMMAAVAALAMSAAAETAEERLNTFKIDPTRQLRFAAQEYTNWVTKISGRTPDLAKAVLSTPRYSAEAAAFAKRHADDFAKLKDSDGFIIAEEDGRLFIVAEKTKGVLNGVYRYLERNSDIIWVRPFESDKDGGCGTIYTKDPAFRNTVKYLCDVPSVKGSRSWSGFYMRGDALHQARNLLGDTQSWDGNLSRSRFDICEELGYPDEFVGGYGFYNLHLKYGKTNPEIFALVNGTREVRANNWDPNLCFSEPKALELYVKEYVAYLRMCPPEVDTISVTLIDGNASCCCEKCLQPIVTPDGKVVKPTDANFRSTQFAVFANRVYEQVRRECPRVKPIKQFAYVFCNTAPAIRPAGGAGDYAPYVKSHKKPVYDDDVNAAWHEKAEGFFKAGLPFSGLYEYYLCYTTPKFPHMVSEVAQKDLQYYLRNCRGNFRRYYLDVCCGDDGGTGDCALARDASSVEFWTISRLMWNADADVRSLRREFCRRAYHEAAPIMADYYEKLSEIYNGDVAGCFWNDRPVSAAKHYIVEKGHAAWVRKTLAAALSAAVDPRCRELIRRHAAVMERWIGEAEKAPKRVETLVPCVTDLKPENDPAAPFWQKAAKLCPITLIGQNKEPGPQHRADYYVAHDRHRLYLLIVDNNKAAAKQLHEQIAKGEYGKPAKPGTPFEWNTPFELYLDGDLGPKGSYYMFAAMYNRRPWISNGTSEIGDRRDWTVDLKERPDGNGITALVSWYLEDFGIEITKNNLVGAQFLTVFSAWNGGQWHNPAGFQTLRFEVK